VQPSPAWLDAMTELAFQYDGKDRWYLEAIGIAARGREDALYAWMAKQHASTDPQFSRIVWELRPKSTLPDLVKLVQDPDAHGSRPALEHRMQALETIGAMQWPEAARAVEAVILNDAAPPALVERAFHLYSQQLFSLWVDSRNSPALPVILKKAFAAPATQRAAVAVADAIEDGRYIADLVALAKSQSASADARAAALDAIAARRDPQYLGDLQAIAEGGPAPIRVAAVRAVATLGRPDVERWAQQIVVSDAPNEVRAEAIRLLARTVDGLTAILDMASQGRLPAELKTLAATLTNYAVPPPAVKRGAAQSPVAMRVSRTATPTDPAYVAIRERAAKVLPMTTAKAIPTALELEFSYVGKADEGRKVFDTAGGCGACHSLGGTKKTLGPDLSGIGAKYGKQAMLDNIVNPNDAIGPEYVMTVLTLKDGSKWRGLVTEEGTDRVVVQTAPDESRRLRPSDIASREELRLSLMPEGLLDGLSLQQIADLLEFLAGQK
jgi:putative heme-binding domain-containing protein